MRAVVEINGVRAETDGRTWTCDNPFMLRILRLVADPDLHLFTSQGHPALRLAEIAVELLGGHVVEYDEPGFTPEVPGLYH